MSSCLAKIKRRKRLIQTAACSANAVYCAVRRHGVRSRPCVGISGADERSSLGCPATWGSVSVKICGWGNGQNPRHDLFGTDSHGPTLGFFLSWDHLQDFAGMYRHGAHEESQTLHGTVIYACRSVGVVLGVNVGIYMECMNHGQWW